MNSTELTNIPEHVAIIMDGNGRWAKKRFLPRTMGHRAGMEALHRIVEAASDLGIKYLTVYAFSTENWKRSSEEVGTLMNLAVEYFIKEIKELNEKNVKVKLIGNKDKLPVKVQEAAHKVEEITKDNTGLYLSVAMNYGGREELTNAIKNIISDNVNIDQIDENLINSYLYTSDLPDPDILIRTGGEKRLSNFLLWQNSYTEFFFVDDWWPDCDKEFLENILEQYQLRNRRFGDAK